ncbi:MAG: hypothetical protein KDI13_10735 [Alphaproteobacteria bacterium]|nr:hypothetical protein [Alphaproteobacteria bacterium]
MMIDRATKEQIEAILAMPQTPPYLKPVFEVVRDYGVGYLTLLQNGDGLEPDKLNSQVPMITVVGDDTNAALGPGAFDSSTLKILTLRASCVSIISSEPVPNIYTLFSLMTGLLRANTLIIETRLEQEHAWVDYIRALAPHTPVILSTSLPEAWET